MKRTATFVVLIALIGAGGLALRLPGLGVRPVHVDEAVHAYKLNELWQTGVYIYDLHEYHGPTLYYATLPVVWLTGADDWRQTEIVAYRIVPALFGVGLILLLLLVADGLGRWTTVWAAILTALSPALVFYSGYYIQETLLVFFTMLVIGAGWRYVRTRHASWAILAGAGVGLMHATKETCVIALASAALAFVLTVLWQRRGTDAPLSLKPWLCPGVLGGATLAAIVVSVVLFSGFFTNAAGPPDSLRAFATYFERAGENGVHVQPWHYYARLLAFWSVDRGPVWGEWLIIALSLVGMAAAIVGKPRDNVALPRFLAIYTVLMVLVYSAIPYKTPWCILSALHGMILLAGYGAVALVRVARPAGTHPKTCGTGFQPVITPARCRCHMVASGLKAAIVVVLIAASVHLGLLAQRASSRKYCAHPGNPYVYATTLHSAADLTRQLEQLADVHPESRRMLIMVMVENCWPLPWYLRRFERVGYWEAVPPEGGADVIITSSRYGQEVAQRLGGDYQVNTHGLRRDERLLVYVRRELWDAFVERLRTSSTRSAP